MRCSADKCSKYITGFRVRAVMTSSIPVHIKAVNFTAFILYMTLRTLSIPFENFPKCGSKKFPSKCSSA